MKKLLSLVLALVLILSVTGAVAISAADNTATVSLYDIGGKLVKTNTYGVGETFEVVVYLNTSQIGTIGSLKAEQDYTSSVLKLADKYNENTGSIADLAAMFPVTKSATVANGKNEGAIPFNASTPDFDPDGFDFCSDDAKLIVTHYTVKAAGNAEIKNIFSTLAYADFELTRIINKGEIINDNFTMKYTLSDPEYVPTEPPTVAPTEPPTEKPTTAPTTPPTIKPTTAPTTPPTTRPTTPPTTLPTTRPTTAPTTPPTTRPTTHPTTPPTTRPTTAPTTPPTTRPTTHPTTPPTTRPTTAPTTPPTTRPTTPPTTPPTTRPTTAPTTPPTTPPTTAPISYILGDVNNDSKVDMLDPTYIRRYCANINTGLSEDSIWHGDVDRNGEVVIMDATYIQQYLAELSVAYPIGKTVTG